MLFIRPLIDFYIFNKLNSNDDLQLNLNMYIWTRGKNPEKYYLHTYEKTHCCLDSTTFCE